MTGDNIFTTNQYIFPPDVPLNTWRATDGSKGRQLRGQRGVLINNSAIGNIICIYIYMFAQVSLGFERVLFEVSEDILNNVISSLVESYPRYSSSARGQLTTILFSASKAMLPDRRAQGTCPGNPPSDSDRYPVKICELIPLFMTLVLSQVTIVLMWCCQSLSMPAKHPHAEKSRVETQYCNLPERVTKRSS
jgi:hypothetical protein